MKDEKQMLVEILDLFDAQRLAVLSTQSNQQPYSSLIAFAVSSDLTDFYFLTPNTTRKYENLISNPKVCILVNNSQNQADDIYKAVSVTGMGIASVVEKDDSEKVMEMFLEKHPQLDDFSRAPTTAFIRIAMSRYFMVNRFQNVIEVKVK